jgi:hypothetical protein
MEQMEFMTAMLLVLVGLALYIYIAYQWNRCSLGQPLLLVLVGMALYIYIAYLWNRWSL